MTVGTLEDESTNNAEARYPELHPMKKEDVERAIRIWRYLSENHLIAISVFVSCLSNKYSILTCNVWVKKR